MIRFLVQSSDLPTKDIRALVAVVCNLYQSAQHADLITAQEVKAKLYHDLIFMQNNKVHLQKNGMYITA